MVFPFARFNDTTPRLHSYSTGTVYCIPVPYIQYFFTVTYITRAPRHSPALIRFQENGSFNHLLRFVRRRERALSTYRTLLAIRCRHFAVLYSSELPCPILPPSFIVSPDPCRASELESVRETGEGEIEGKKERKKESYFLCTSTVHSLLS